MALEAVRDPGNLGTIVRTADAVGAAGVILVGDTVDPFSVEAVRATMGSIFAVPLARATRPNSRRSRGAGRARWSARTSPARPTTARRTTATPVLLVMGGEQAGLTPEAAALCADAGQDPDGRQGRFAQPRRRDRRHAVRDPAREPEARHERLAHAADRTVPLSALGARRRRGGGDRSTRSPSCWRSAAAAGAARRSTSCRS